MRKPVDALAVSMMIVLCMCWGFQQITIKVAAAGISPIMQAGLRSIIATALLLAMVLVSALGILPLLTAAMLTAGLMVATRTITPTRARRAIDLRVLLTIAAAFGVGAALTASGAASTIAAEVVSAAAPFGALGLLTAVYTTTVVLSAVVTTNAAAVLMFPIAFASAERAGIEFKPFMYCLMLAASANFMNSPVPALLTSTSTTRPSPATSS